MVWSRITRPPRTDVNSAHSVRGPSPLWEIEGQSKPGYTRTHCTKPAPHWTVLRGHVSAERLPPHLLAGHVTYWLIETDMYPADASLAAKPSAIANTIGHDHLEPEPLPLPQGFIASRPKRGPAPEPKTRGKARGLSVVASSCPPCAAIATAR